MQIDLKKMKTVVGERNNNNFKFVFRIHQFFKKKCLEYQVFAKIYVLKNKIKNLVVCYYHYLCF